VQALAEWRSQRWLARLMDQFGTPGLAAALTAPGVAAVVDQHAAAVRDILLLGVEAGPRQDRLVRCVAEVIGR
jgi:hypothetical protein